MNKRQRMELDLQLFSQEKTEKATPKKRREAREQGQVIRSVEINTAVTILVAFYIMKLFAGPTMAKLKELFISFLYIDGNLEGFFTYSNLQKVLITTTAKVLLAVLPIIGSCFLVGIILNYAQVGFLFTTKPLKPDLNRINPIQGFKRLFSKRAIYELLKSLLKLGIILGVVYDVFLDSMRTMPMLLDMQIRGGFSYICNQVFKIATKCGFALLAMSIFDYIYQWWDHERSLRMTKHEVKEEHKQTEGDPQVKGRIREMQRQLSLSRMMQDVAKADVIVTNPTHFAVALVYDSDKDDAPLVLAKGKDHMALRIRDRAKEYDIAVVEDKPLAQALYHTTEIGQVIPPELYHAVAEVLAYVYGLKDEN